MVPKRGRKRFFIQRTRSVGIGLRKDIKRHRTEILSFLGINRLSEPVKESFSKWLVNEIYPQGQIIPDAKDLAYNWFKKHRTESPTDTVLYRLVRAAFNQYENRFFEKIVRSLSADAKEIMDVCLEGRKEVIEFSNLKADPERVGLESVLNETEKLQFIRSLCLPKDVFQSISSKNLKRYYNRISGETAWEVKRHPQEIKYSLLAIFLYFRQREIIDGLIELFIQIVRRLSVKAERDLVRELMRDFQRVHGKTTLLFKIAEAALLNPDGLVRDVVYPVAGENTLQNLLKEFKSSGPGYKKQVHKIIRASYSSHYRPMVPKILENLEFCSGNMQHRPVLMGLNLIQQLRDQTQRFIPLNEEIPIEGVILNKWREVVIEEDGQGRERIN